MPIYAYKCTACGHAEDVLRKISDKPLTVCPQCNQETYAKQVTAAGFQLKGSGWYVTDFRNNSSSGGAKTAEVAPGTTAADAKPAATESGGAGSPTDASSGASSGAAAGGSNSASNSSSNAAAPASAPAAPAASSSSSSSGSGSASSAS